MARHQIWAPPLVFGPWQEIAGHIGKMTYTITVEQIGDIPTLVIGEIKYFSESGEKTVSFKDEQTITTSDSTASVKIRLQGTPLGTSCWVDI